MRGVEMRKLGCEFPNGKVAVQSPESKELTVYATLDEFKLDVRDAGVPAQMRVTFIDETP
jgi:hypothetical protein